MISKDVLRHNLDSRLMREEIPPDSKYKWPIDS